jgi:DNA polymerase III epsilon subunit-like protein
MNYISLDLEWNQAYAQKALAVQKRLECRLRGEVIQIGAVKLDADLNIIGSYRITVKPKFFKSIQRHVMRLTGITQTMLDHGTPLPEAIARCEKWCGEDFAFLTWGPDDIPMLKENLAVHGIESSWLDRVYDLQTIFNAQTDKSKQQRSLEYAMEHFEIEQTLPSHDALNDAYFTALVAQKLDMKLGISSYRGSDEEFLFDQTYGDSNIGEDGYVEISEFFEEEKSELHECPICKKEVKHENKSLHCKGHRYVTLYSCPEHGELFLQIKMYKNFDESWRARKTVALAKEEDIAEYIRRLDENEERKKRRRKAKKA